MKIKYAYLMLILTVLAVGCTPTNNKSSHKPKKYKIPILASEHLDNITLDNTVTNLFDLQYNGLSKGKHTIKINEKEYSFIINESSHILLNFSNEMIIKEELYFGKGSHQVTEKDFKTPYKILSFEDQIYIGPYQTIDDIIVKNWNYGINQEIPKTIQVSSAYDGVIQQTLGRNPYKIYTKEEFVQKATSLNKTNEWIQNQLEKNISKLDKAYTISIEQSNYIVVKKAAEGFKASIGKVTTRGFGSELDFTKVIFYNKKKHGKITKQVAIIKNCFFEKDKKNRTISIVFSDKHNRPHIKIIK